MDIIPIILVCVMTFTVFMMIRNQVVYAVYMDWVRLASRATDIIIDNDVNQYERLISAMPYSEILGLIGSYNSMMFKFWCLDMRSFFSGDRLKMYDQLKEIVELGESKGAK